MVGKLSATLMLWAFLVTAVYGSQRINEQGMSLSLNLQQAIDYAKHNNVMLKIARQRIEEARGRRWQNDSDLLPHLSLAISQGRTFWENFAAQGMLPFFAMIPPGSSDHLILLMRAFKSLNGFLI